MLKEERHQKLLKVLAEKEFATVEELSKSLLVSMPTIRRDLTELARRKLIIRNHGGAMHIPTENVIAPVDFRKSVNYKKKNLLAREAVKFALNNMVVFLDGSTTASYLCDHCHYQQLDDWRPFEKPGPANLLPWGRGNRKLLLCGGGHGH